MSTYLTLGKSWVNFDWLSNQENLSSDSTDPNESLGTSSTGMVIREILVSTYLTHGKSWVNFDWHSNQENLSTDSTDPDESLGTSLTGMVIKDILVSTRLTQIKSCEDIFLRKNPGITLC